MKYISIIRGKFGRLSRREKRRFLLLFAVDIWIILLFLWVQQNHAGEEPAYVLAPGTPQRMILSLLLINCTVIALIAGGVVILILAVILGGLIKEERRIVR